MRYLLIILALSGCATNQAYFIEPLGPGQTFVLRAAKPLPDPLNGLFDSKPINLALCNKRYPPDECWGYWDL